MEPTSPDAVTYRLAEPKHAEAIAAQGRAAFIEAFAQEYKSDELAAYLDKTYGPGVQAAELRDPAVAIFIACHDGEVIGHVKLAATDWAGEQGGASALEIGRFYLLAAWTGKGVAQELLVHARQEARRRGAAWVYLSCWSGNARAIAFYQREGFAIVGRQAFAVGARIDEDHIMRCDTLRAPDVR